MDSPFIFIIPFFFIFMALIYSGGSTPVVQFSHSKGYCVEVINFTEDDKYSCENMPEKYSSEWVK